MKILNETEIKWKWITILKEKQTVYTNKVSNSQNVERKKK